MERRRIGVRLFLAVGVAVIALVIALYALFVFALGQVPEWTTTAQVCQQPNTVSYEKGSSYEVVIKQPSLSLALSSGPPRAVVGRSGNDGTYGVFVELNSSTNPKLVTCRWEPDRVEIVEPNGIVHSVPASFFIGGR